MTAALIALTLLVLLPICAARPFVGVLVWSWVSFMNPHRMAWGTVREMPWAALVLGATLIGCVIAREPRRAAFDLNAKIIIAFMICISLTSLTALAPADVVTAKWSGAFKVLCVLLLTNSLLTDRRRIHAMVWIMVISLGHFGVRGGAFAIATAGAYRVYGPPDTMIEDNNHLAAALLVTLPLIGYLRAQSRHAIVRQGLAVAFGLSLLSVFSSYSRGALLGLGAVSLFLWRNTRRKGVAAIALVVVIGAATLFMPAEWTERMDTIFAQHKDESAETRLTMWRTSFTMAMHRPLTGSGFMGPYTQSVVDQFVPGAPARAVHSIYFEVIGEHGFVTFAVWLSLSAVGWLNAARIRRMTANRPEVRWANDLARMAQVSIIAYLVAGTFLSLSYWDFYLTLLVTIAATRRCVVAELAKAAAAAGTGAAVAGRWRRAPGYAPGYAARVAAPARGPR